MALQTVGLGTSNHAFQMHGSDEQGRAVLCKRLRRAQISALFGSPPRCVGGLEPPQRSHYLTRVIGLYGQPNSAQHGIILRPPSQKWSSLCA